ncbi:MBL fold metallo-hydrolase [Priestia endophytica]|uniref:MBL fold metallo-hydrolase n=1 Tax=Priestia endophytica TaxID=135735 RepID=UPI003D284846
MENIYQITVPTPYQIGDVHLYVIVNDSITLIDAGVKTEKAWADFKNQLASLHLTVEDIDQVILTHHHPDHVGLLHYLPSVPVYGHPHIEPWLTYKKSTAETYNSYFENLFLQLSVPYSYKSQIPRFEGQFKYGAEAKLAGTLSEGASPPLLKGWKVLHMPGHAGNHIALYHEEKEELIAGDVLLDKIVSNPLIEPPFFEGEHEKPQLEYNNSLQRLLSLKVQKLYPGHGKVIENVSELTRERMIKQRKKAESLLPFLEEGKTGFEICQHLFPHAYEKQLALTLSMTLAQLHYLEEVGYIQKVEKQGKWFFRKSEVKV